jgi:hypothetical protein
MRLFSFVAKMSIWSDCSIGEVHWALTKSEPPHNVRSLEIFSGLEMDQDSSGLLTT